MVLSLIKSECFGFFKHIVLSVIFIILFVLLFQPSMELIGLGALYGIQIINTLYLFNDFFYTNIKGDDISMFLIILSLIISYVAFTIIIYGIVKLNIKYTIKPRDIQMNDLMRKSLTSFEILYIINYVVLIIISILYFLSLPIKIPTIKNGGLTFIELIINMVKIIFSIGSIVLSGIMLYDANVFALFIDTPVINIV